MLTKQGCIMHLHLWLETKEGMFFGPGRAELLERVEYHGSLLKAADDLGMSYRAAWGKIKKTEAVLGCKLIEKTGSYRKGYRLTDYGRMLAEKFRLWYNDVEEDALQKARTVFGVPVERQEEKGLRLEHCPDV
jgi:molybdate transport system regulatory protein